MPTPAPLPPAQNAPSMAVEACSKMVEAATKTCAPANVAPAPNWDAMANSFASLSTAFTFGSILLAIIALGGAIAWGLLVKVWAEREARAEAQRLAKDCADEWMAKNAPAIIQKHVEFLRDASVGDSDDDKAADKIGEGA